MIAGDILPLRVNMAVTKKYKEVEKPPAIPRYPLLSPQEGQLSRFPLPPGETLSTQQQVDG